MKKITLFALIGFSILLILDLYGIGINIYNYLEMEYNMFLNNSIICFIRTVGIAFITYFFFALYKKTKNMKIASFYGLIGATLWFLTIFISYSIIIYDVGTYKFFDEFILFNLIEYIAPIGLILFIFKFKNRLG